MLTSIKISKQMDHKHHDQYWRHSRRRRNHDDGDNVKEGRSGKRRRRERRTKCDDDESFHHLRIHHHRRHPSRQEHEKRPINDCHRTRIARPTENPGPTEPAIANLQPPEILLVQSLHELLWTNAWCELRNKITNNTHTFHANIAGSVANDQRRCTIYYIVCSRCER